MTAISTTISFAAWAIIIGLLLVTMVLSSRVLKRLPLSTAMMYMAVGIALGPWGWALLTPAPLQHATMLELTTEIALLFSLFAAGLKLGLPLSDRGWLLPLRLSIVSMLLTVAMITLIAVFGLGLSVGASVLLAGILAPTDPVLASDVQVEHAGDRDRLRFCLTGEAGFNDGTAFPIVMLGLGILGLHDIGAGGWRWVVVDVIWATGAGLLIGAALGALIGKLVLYLRSRHQESAAGFDEFLALGLIALAYGFAVSCHAYGFLAVFAAGLALQRVREQSTAPSRASESAQHALPCLAKPEASANNVTDPREIRSWMMNAVQSFNSQLENICELAVVIVVGAMLNHITDVSALWLIPLFFVIVRPLSIWLGLLGAPVSRDQRRLMSWFGIRGIGSLFYLMYAINHGIPAELARQLTALTLMVVAASIVFHGISVTPLMSLYTRRKERPRADR
jgi:NhaP-type Na+/H+ or K+/H+ antiporter